MNQLGDTAEVNREAIIKQANADLPGLADLTYLNGEAGSVLFPAGEENQTLFSTGLMIDSGSGSSLSLQTKILGYAIASREIQGKGEVPIFSLVPENLREVHLANEAGEILAIDPAHEYRALVLDAQLMVFELSSGEWQEIYRGEINTAPFYREVDISKFAPAGELDRLGTLITVRETGLSKLNTELMAGGFHLQEDEAGELAIVEKEKNQVLPDLRVREEGEVVYLNEDIVELELGNKDFPVFFNPESKERYILFGGEWASLGRAVLPEKWIVSEAGDQILDEQGRMIVYQENDQWISARESLKLAQEINEDIVEIVLSEKSAYGLDSEGYVKAYYDIVAKEWRELPITAQESGKINVFEWSEGISQRRDIHRNVYVMEAYNYDVGEKGLRIPDSDIYINTEIIALIKDTNRDEFKLARIPTALYNAENGGYIMGSFITTPQAILEYNIIPVSNMSIKTVIANIVFSYA